MTQTETDDRFREIVIMEYIRDDHDSDPAMQCVGMMLMLAPILMVLAAILFL